MACPYKARRISHHHHEMSRRSPGKIKHKRQRFPVPTSVIHSHSTGKTSTSRCRILGKSDRFPFSCKQSGRGDMSDLLSAQCGSIERTCEALQLNVQLVAQPVGSFSLLASFSRSWLSSPPTITSTVLSSLRSSRCASRGKSLTPLPLTLRPASSSC